MQWLSATDLVIDMVEGEGGVRFEASQHAATLHAFHAFHASNAAALHTNPAFQVRWY